jgi:hypothetical protein
LSSVPRRKDGGDKPATKPTTDVAPASKAKRRPAPEDSTGLRRLYAEAVRDIDSDD